MVEVTFFTVDVKLMVMENYFFIITNKREHERSFFGKKIDKILMCDEKF